MSACQLALQAWMQTAALISSDGRCCYHPHFTLDDKPLGDHEVCIREKRWREYVRERDGNYDFPYHIRETNLSYLAFKDRH